MRQTTTRNKRSIPAAKLRNFVNKQNPNLTKFIALSLALHLSAAYIYYLTPEKKTQTSLKKQVKVKFIPSEPEIPKSLEAPERIKKKTPSFKKLIPLPTKQTNLKSEEKKAAFKKIKKMTQKQPDQRVKASKKMRLHKKIKKKSPPKKKLSSLKRSNKSKKFSQKRNENKEKFLTTQNYVQSIGVMAMLNKLDADKYASLETGTIEDDDEAISLNTKETKYADYFARVKFQIEQVWTYPMEAARHGVSGQSTLKFKLSREGNLVGVRLVESSGTSTLDEAALKAVKKASPYYPFPPNFQKDSITILATFIYSPTYSNSMY